MQDIQLPKSFLNRMKRQLGIDFQLFFDSFSLAPNISVRLNPAKPTASFRDAESIPWNKYGKYLSSRPDFVFDPLIHAGAYYVQEPSSMLFGQAIDFSKDLLVLDLCASPGGKSTLLLSELSPGSLLFSNEMLRKRAGILVENLVKWGNSNVVVTSNAPSDFNNFTGLFDVVVIDAPCSGEGMFRKDPETIREWKENKPFQCSVIQKNILDEAVGLVKNNGLLIYMTCTYSEEENEHIVNWFLNKNKQNAELTEMVIDPDWGIMENHTENGKVYRCYPHHIRGEGMFIALFRMKNNKQAFFNRKYLELLKSPGKYERELLNSFFSFKEDYQPFKFNDSFIAVQEKFLFHIATALKKLNVLKAGTKLGNIPYNKSGLIPNHESALSPFISKSVPRIELSYTQALAYLKKLPFDIDFQTDKQWFLATYEGISLGWIKKHETTYTNFYPREWAIRKNLPENITNELKINQ